MVRVDNNQNIVIWNKPSSIKIDPCGLESNKSPFHKTMHLSLNQGQNNVCNLIQTGRNENPIDVSNLKPRIYI